MSAVSRNVNLIIYFIEQFPSLWLPLLYSLSTRELCNNYLKAELKYMKMARFKRPVRHPAWWKSLIARTTAHFMPRFSDAKNKEKNLLANFPPCHLCHVLTHKCWAWRFGWPFCRWSCEDKKRGHETRASVVVCRERKAGDLVPPRTWAVKASSRSATVDCAVSSISSRVGFRNRTFTCEN